MLKAIGILWCCVSCLLTYAQPFHVSGTITDSASIGLPSATVIFVTGKDTVTVLGDESGRFSSVVPKKQFILEISAKGYVSFTKAFSFDSNEREVRLQTIALQVDYHDLDPVTVTRSRPITIGEDTITYHASAFSVREGSEVEALLKHLPGVEVDQTGNVIVQGKKISKVMVNGKLFFGGDVLTAIRNLPADIVDKVQVIDDYGDKARLTGVKSGDPLKVLNIVLKGDKRNGQFGHIQTGIGNYGKYTHNAFANSFSGEKQLAVDVGVENNNPAGKNIQKHANLSYADRSSEKWKSEANLNFSGDDPHAAGNQIQDNYFPGGQTHQEQAIQTTGSNRNANFAGTLTYTPDIFHTFRFSPSMNIQRNEQSITSDFLTVQQNSSFSKTSKGHSLTTTHADNDNAALQFYFEQLSKKTKKRFSTEANVQYNNNQQFNDNLLSTTVQLDSQQSLSRQHYLANSTSPTWALGANINYFTPIGKTGFVDLGYYWHDNLSHNLKYTRQQDSLHSEPFMIDSLSQVYFYHSMDYRFHTGYIVHFHQLHLTLGLDAQPGHLTGNTAEKGKNVQYYYFNWLPSAQASYSLTKSKTLSFQYTGNSSIPGLQQVQPLTDLSNPQFPVVGNPKLKPAYNHNTNLHYEHNSLQATQYWGFSLDLGYNATQNSIIQNIIHPEDSSTVIQRTSYLNAGSLHSITTGYHLSLHAFLKKRLRITLNGQLSSSTALSMTDNLLRKMASLNATQSMHFQYIIPDYLESDLSGNYSITRTGYPDAGGSPTHFSAAGWSLNNRHFLFRKWIINYQFSQSYTSGSLNKLQPNPAFMSASLQRQFLSRNRATMSIYGYDLLNTSSSVSQYFSATSVTKSQATLTGRYFIVQFLYKWGKFKE